MEGPAGGRGCRLIRLVGAHQGHGQLGEKVGWQAPPPSGV